MKRNLLIFLLLINNPVYSQRDYHWIFGDSVGINFNTNPPTVDTSKIIDSHEPSACISDNYGNLLFYVGSSNRDNLSIGCKKYTVRCSNDSIMPGGDSLAGHCSITQGLIILPDPGDTNKYYIFHIQWAGNNLYYSIVDMSLNNGLGQVISLNNLLADSISEKMHAVKAGNGKYWWLVTTGNYPNGNFYKYLIDSNAIHPVIIQQANLNMYSGAGQMIFSPDGSKLLFAGAGASSLLFDFDRCNGIISNQQIVNPWYWTSSGEPRYGCSFSPSGRFAYISSFDSLWQYDTQSANISLSKTLVATVPNPPLYYGFGQHLLSPDGKIYIATTFDQNNTQGLDSIISHLTVISSPDSVGINCNVMPFSFSLNGRKSYLNLPNMPNYNLGPLENVNCDSILAVNESEGSSFKIFPNPGKGKFSIKLLKQAEKVTVKVFNLLGNNIYTRELPGSSMELDLTSLSEGVYLMQLTDENRVTGSRKIVVLK